MLLYCVQDCGSPVLLKWGIYTLTVEIIICWKQNVFPDSQGYFQEKILLENGKNRLVIRAVSNNGAESKLIKEVFFESDADIKINERTFGLLVDNKKITVNKSFVVLDLFTRPLSRIEIKSKRREWLKTGYADTLGNCSITFPMSELHEEF